MNTDVNDLKLSIINCILIYWYRFMALLGCYLKLVKYFHGSIKFWNNVIWPQIFMTFHFVNLRYVICFSHSNLSFVLLIYTYWTFNPIPIKFLILHNIHIQNMWITKFGPYSVGKSRSQSSHIGNHTFCHDSVPSCICRGQWQITIAPTWWINVNMSPPPGHCMAQSCRGCVW